MAIRFTGFLAIFSIAAFLAAAPAHAAVTTYAFTFNGASENPTNASAATGTGTAAYDDAAHTLTLIANITGLQGTVTQAHFHGGTTTSGLPDNNPVGETLEQAAAAVANASIAVGNPSLLNFPIGGNSVAYNQVIDLTLASSYNNNFLTNNGGTTASAEAAFAGLLSQARTYWNIHTAGPPDDGFPGGEVRGFPRLIPEPTGGALALMGLAALAIRRRRVSA
jgi:MYXO-CTERM domain-containing protein